MHNILTNCERKCEPDINIFYLDPKGKFDDVTKCWCTVQYFHSPVCLLIFLALYSSIIQSFYWFKVKHDDVKLLMINHDGGITRSFLVYTGCLLNIVFFLNILWFFWTLPVLLHRWCSTCLMCVHTLTHQEKTESGIF